MSQSMLGQVAIDLERSGEDMYTLAERLYPICRSITGDGVRQTLGVIAEYIPLEVHEVPTGTRVFDWTVPREWNITDAYIKNEHGERVVDFRECNLHVLSYSVPVHAKLSLDELKQHLYTLPDRPERIPYRTSYYNEAWGFCLSHNQMLALEEGLYEVCIESSLTDGHLTYGEYVLEGETQVEVLLSAHVCHPSLANDNLSGIAVLTCLAKYLKAIGHRYTYRFVFAPGTIGSITWLAHNEAVTERIEHGLVVSCMGDGGGPTYKRSRRGDAEVDRAVEHVLRHSAGAPRIEDFSPYGYDERQYGSPAFNLPVGLLERSKYGEFPEYHTSADNLDFISAGHLGESAGMLARVLEVLEADARYMNLNPKCEPQLGKRGLYASVGGDIDRANKQMAMLWVLNQSDGSRSLLDIAERANLPFGTVLGTASLLAEHGLLRSA